MQFQQGGNEQRIKLRAYEIWEEEGRPEGRAQEHWRRAEAELGAQQGEAQGRTEDLARSYDTASQQAGALKSKPAQGAS